MTKRLKESALERFLVCLRLEVATHGVDARTLQEAIRQGISRTDFMGDTSGEVKSLKVFTALDRHPEDESQEGTQAIACVGNLVEGFRFVGPYPDFDFAAEAWDDSDAWIATLHAPAVPPTVDRWPSQLEALVAQLKTRQPNNLSESLNDVVHDVASRIGSSINNQGWEAQVKFLVDQVGYEEAKALIEEILARDN